MSKMSWALVYCERVLYDVFHLHSWIHLCVTDVLFSYGSKYQKVIIFGHIWYTALCCILSYIYCVVSRCELCLIHVLSLWMFQPSCRTDLRPPLGGAAAPDNPTPQRTHSRWPTPLRESSTSPLSPALTRGMMDPRLQIPQGATSPLHQEARMLPRIAKTAASQASHALPLEKIKCWTP